MVSWCGYVYRIQIPLSLYKISTFVDLSVKWLDMAKYCPIAFFLWLFGGWFGLHHFYLRRDRQGFLWATTWGGFLVGWLRDFTNLGRYVEEANTEYPLRQGSPRLWSNVHRLIGQVMFGLFFRWLVMSAVPETLPDIYRNVTIMIVAPIGSAFGCYMVSNVGHICCSYKYALSGAYLGEILFGTVQMTSHDWPSSAVLVSALFCVYGWEERKRKTRTRFCKRFLLWFSLGMVVSSLWLSYGYFNVEVYIEETDQTVKLRDLFHDFLRSPVWDEMKELLSQAWKLLWESGWDTELMWKLLQEGLLDAQLQRSMDIFEFKEHKEITHDQVRLRYRRLAKEWHPDRHPTDGKAAAQERFIEIQRAYETLKRWVKIQESSSSD